MRTRATGQLTTVSAAGRQNEKVTQHIPEDLNLIFHHLTDARDKENAWRTAVTQRDTQEDISLGLVTQLAAYVQNISGGDEAKILSSGFQVRNTTPTPATPTAPGDLRATTGDQEGEIDLAWDRVRGASSYHAECREHTDPVNWQSVKTVTQSKLTIPGLIPGKVYAFRVRAITAQGEGPWSDEAIKRVV